VALAVTCTELETVLPEMGDLTTTPLTVYFTVLHPARSLVADARPPPHLHVEIVRSRPKTVTAQIQGAAAHRHVGKLHEMGGIGRKV
jgi:hypothetical protein